MINWLLDNPILIAAIQILLMWTDWLLSVAQAREVKKYYHKHYQSYPINTIEGNPILQKDVKKDRIFNLKHFITSIIIGVVVFFSMKYLPKESQEYFIGFSYGIFLLVITQHLSNLLGYRASRKGVQGKLFIHLRTGYLVQAGRYFSTTILLLILAIISDSQFIYGMSIASFTSVLRQFSSMKRTPPIKSEDETFNEKDDNEMPNA